MIVIGLLGSVSVGYLTGGVNFSNTANATSGGSTEAIATQNFEQAMNLIQQGKSTEAGKLFTQAISGYEEALKKDPNNIQNLGDLATAYFYMGNTDKAIQLAKKALEIEPKFTTVRLNYAKYLFYGKNNSVEAMKELKKIEKGDINYDSAQQFIGEIGKSSTLPPKGSSLPAGNSSPPSGNPSFNGNTLPPNGGGSSNQ